MHLGQIGITSEGATNRIGFMVEGDFEGINSTNLGDRERLRMNVSGEYVQRIGQLRLSAGAGLLMFSDRAPLPTGGIETSFELSPFDPTDVIYVSGQRSGRIPTYTELYYSDPATQGNAGLVSESAWTIDAGYRRTAGMYTWQLSLFSRWGDNIIDYAIDPETEIGTAQNITKVNVAGVDLSGAVRFTIPVLREIKASVLLQEVTATSPVRTRYTADNLNLLSILEPRFEFPLGINATYVVRIFRRVTDGVTNVTHDAKLYRAFGPVTILAEATNITNQNYVEAGFIAAPPRWFRMGAELRLR